MQPRPVALLRPALESYFLLLLIDPVYLGESFLFLDSVICTFYQPTNCFCTATG